MTQKLTVTLSSRCRCRLVDCSCKPRWKLLQNGVYLLADSALLVNKPECNCDQQQSHAKPEEPMLLGQATGP